MSENQFNHINFDDWQAAATAALRGQPLDGLSKPTYDDILVNPLYPAAPHPDQPSLPTNTWQINQAINHPDIESAATQILEDLEQGVNSLSLHSNQALQSNGYGINLNQVNIKKLFKNTYLDMVSLRLETGLDEIKSAKLIENHYKKLKKQGQLSLGIDPIGKFTQFGGWDGEANAKSSVQSALLNFKATHILRADGRIAHNAGASEAQELNFILSTAITYLKWADDVGLDLNHIAPKIEICISASQNQFLTIAKIRAVRHLWAELLDGLDIEQSDAHIYAETSFRMVSKADPWVNVLRATVACFSAGIGGADQIGILPLSAAIGLAPAFDRRLARHIQTILIEESHLADVTDPAHGSGYIESLTRNLTEKSWGLFQNTQRTGGILTNLLAGNIQRQINNISSHRAQNLAANNPTLIGASGFLNPDETPYETLKINKTKIDTPKFNTTVAPLTAKRDAEPFEDAKGAAHV